MGEPGTLAEQRADLEGSWQAFVGRAVSRVRGIRPEILSSWSRSAGFLPPDRRSAPVDDEAANGDSWRESPLSAAVTPLDDQLSRLAWDYDMVVAVADHRGRILWTHGGRTMLRRAAEVNFVPGGRWDESSIGTNALSIALDERRPATVFAAEHYSPAVHGWVCYAAPIVDASTARQVGVLDLSTTWDRSNPMALDTAVALARAASALLPSAVLVDAPGQVDTFTLTMLGRGAARLGSTPLLLTHRQTEIAALLALHPAGLTLEELHANLYGDDPVRLSTLKAEVSRLRRVLAGGISSRPYRLTMPVRTDVDGVLASLRTGRVSGVLPAATPLLPWSDSPFFAGLREELTVAVRDAVLHSHDPGLAAAYAEAAADDLEAAEHALALLADDDPRAALVRARISRLSVGSW